MYAENIFSGHVGKILEHIGYIDEPAADREKVIILRASIADFMQKSIDHIIPVSIDGTNDFGNLVTSCATCNEKKSAMREQDRQPTT